MGICEKIWSSGVSPKRASKMQLRNVNLRFVGPSVQKLWPTTFFAKKMPCILQGAAKKIRDTISSQVSGLAQLPDDLKFRVDQESNTYKSGGETWWFLSLANVWLSRTSKQGKETTLKIVAWGPKARRQQFSMSSLSPVLRYVVTALFPSNSPLRARQY